MMGKTADKPELFNIIPYFLIQVWPSIFIKVLAKKKGDAIFEALPRS